VRALEAFEQHGAVVDVGQHAHVGAELYRVSGRAPRGRRRWHRYPLPPARRVIVDSAAM
jgi:hypothetical protein